MEKADIGVIGMAVMGQNLALNIADHGYRVVVFNRTVSKVDEFLQGAAKGSTLIGAHSLPEFFQQLKRPRKVLLMVKAGEAVDQFIEACLPYLTAGDILIDGGNSLFTDTERRCRDLQQKSILFVGAGISGGEEGARHGPSIMPGGNKEAWPYLKPILQAISAKVEGCEPCCDWVGEGGAGHYVKMIHNGIEYGDMQLISEAYQLMNVLLKFDAEKMHRVFADWNQSELESYLIEITSQIFLVKDSDGKPLLDKILDRAGQKGTGKWTAESALELGVPLTLITEALFSRFLSALKEERLLASQKLIGPQELFTGDAEDLTEAIRQALYASKIISYAQGFMLLRQAAKAHGWQLDCGAIALLWRGGCIIRSRFLGEIKAAYSRQPDLANLMLDPFFTKALTAAQKKWRQVIAAAAQYGVSSPCLSAALLFFDGYRSARLPANLLQAQRDFFGAHTYERVDQPAGKFFHTEWNVK